MRLIELLAALQSMDSKMDGHRRRYAEIQQALKMPDSLVNAQKNKEECEARLAHWRRERKQREAAVADQIRHIKDQEQQLYGGRIKDAREQVAMQKNVESLKKHLGTLEEGVLEAIMELEQAEQDVAAAGEQLSREQAAWAEKEAALLAEKEAIIADARTLKAKRTQVAGQLPADVLSRYERLRKAKQGIAVAKLQHGSCSGCGASLPKATQQRLYGDALVKCPLCGRILSL